MHSEGSSDDNFLMYMFMIRFKWFELSAIKQCLHFSLSYIVIIYIFNIMNVVWIN